MTSLILSLAAAACCLDGTTFSAATSLGGTTFSVLSLSVTSFCLFTSSTFCLPSGEAFFFSLLFDLYRSFLSTTLPENSAFYAFLAVINLIDFLSANLNTWQSSCIVSIMIIKMYEYLYVNFTRVLWVLIHLKLIHLSIVKETNVSTGRS